VGEVGTGHSTKREQKEIGEERLPATLGKVGVPSGHHLKKKKNRLDHTTRKKQKPKKTDKHRKVSEKAGKKGGATADPVLRAWPKGRK